MIDQDRHRRTVIAEPKRVGWTYECYYCIWICRQTECRIDGPNVLDSKVRNRVVNQNCCSNALVIMIQIHRTQLHIDKDVSSVWKVAEVKDFDDILMTAIAQLFDCP